MINDQNRKSQQTIENRRATRNGRDKIEILIRDNTFNLHSIDVLRHVSHYVRFQLKFTNKLNKQQRRCR